MTRPGTSSDAAGRLAHADPRAVEYVRLRWAERWASLLDFDLYAPSAWSAAIRRWAGDELDRIEELLARVDAIPSGKDAA